MEAPSTAEVAEHCRHVAAPPQPKHRAADQAAATEPRPPWPPSTADIPEPCRCVADQAAESLAAEHGGRPRRALQARP